MKKSPLIRISDIRLGYLAAIVVALCWLQYGNTLGHGYTLDDAIVIESNSAVQSGFSGLPDLFVKRESNQLSDQYGYRPITLISFALDIELFGSNALGGHIMGLLYFSILCVVMLFTLARLFPGAGKGFAFFVTILFIVHPLHVEAVANIKSRDEVLSLLFALVALQFAIGMFRKEQWWRGLSAFVMLGFAALCKESAITFIAVLPLGILMQEGKNWQKKFSYAILVASGAIITVLGIFWLSQASTTVPDSLPEQTGLFRESNIMGNAIFQPHTNIDRYATGTRIMGQYLKDFIVPYPLVYYHGYNYVPLTNWSDIRVWLSLLIHLGLLWVAFRYFSRHRPLSFGILFYFITASPYTHFLRPLDDAMADRFMFTPSLGLLIVVVAAIGLLFGVIPGIPNSENPVNQWEKQNSLLQKMFIPAMAVLLLAGFARTAIRNTVWKDNLTLFSNDIRYLEEDCARCNYHYADALTRAYQNQPHAATIDQEIIRHLRKAIDITPQAYNSYILLGNTYYRLGKADEGIKVFEGAMANFPGAARPWFFVGKGKMMQNKPADALPYLEKARDMAADREEHYFMLGWAWYQTGNQYKGIEIIQYAQTRWPGTLEYYNALSEMYWGIGETATALQALSTLVQRAPDYRDAYIRLIDRYRQLGDSTQADLYLNLGRQRGVLP